MKSNGIKKTSIGRGQTLMTTQPMDNSNGMPEIKSSMAEANGFKGSATDLSRSLGGASVGKNPGQ